MRIVIVGMNHETASVELRECLATEPASSRKALEMIRNLECINEGLLLSTCNRVEALITTDVVEEAQKAVIDLMSDLGRISPEDLLSSLYILEDLNAVRHIFRVASSLDSMMVGEPQILGQIKAAYAESTKEKTSGVILNRLLHRAFHVAKRVRTETQISEAAVSISYAAVELAKKIFHVLQGKKVLLVGAGEMAELAAKHLISQGVEDVFVCNRTFERALEVADRFKAHPLSMEEISLYLPEVDIVITSTASPEYVIQHGDVKSCLKKRRNRSLFFIDIAVPRDVDPRVNDLDNIYLYDIDDLKGVIALNKAQREQEALKAERIVQEEVSKFDKWLKTLAVVPTIVSLREKAESIVQAELRKSSSTLGQLTQPQTEAVYTLVKSISEKILNDPILYLKGRVGRPTMNLYLDVTKKLFNLDQDQGERNEQR